MPKQNRTARTPPSEGAWQRPTEAAYPQPFEPMALPVRQALATLGLSRSALYRAAAAGQITLLKLGRSTLVHMPSGRAFIAALPRASIRSLRGGRTG